MNPKPFLDTLFKDSQGLLELRALGAGPARQEFSPLDAFTRIHSFCFNATLQKRNVYFGVATRDGKAGTKENLVSVPAVWCDIDFKETPKEVAIKTLQDFPSRLLPLLPVVVESTAIGALKNLFRRPRIQRPSSGWKMSTGE